MRVFSEAYRVTKWYSSPPEKCLPHSNLQLESMLVNPVDLSWGYYWLSFHRGHLAYLLDEAPAELHSWNLVCLCLFLLLCHLSLSHTSSCSKLPLQTSKAFPLFLCFSQSPAFYSNYSSPDHMDTHLNTLSFRKCNPLKKIAATNE